MCVPGKVMQCCLFMVVHLPFIQGIDGMHRDAVLFLLRAWAKLLPTYLKLYIDPHIKGGVIESLNLPTAVSLLSCIRFGKLLILLEFMV